MEPIIEAIMELVKSLNQEQARIVLAVLIGMVH